MGRGDRRRSLKTRRIRNRNKKKARLKRLRKPSRG